MSVVISSNEERACGCRSKALDQKAMSCAVASVPGVAKICNDTHRFSEISVNLAPKYVELELLSAHVQTRSRNQLT